MGKKIGLNRVLEKQVQRIYQQAMQSRVRPQWSFPNFYKHLSVLSSYGGCSFRLGQIQAQPKSEPNGKQGGHIPWVQVAIDYFQNLVIPTLDRIQACSISQWCGQWICTHLPSLQLTTYRSMVSAKYFKFKTLKNEMDTSDLKFDLI